MKFHLLSAASSEYKELEAITYPTKSSYAKQHGYTCSRVTHVDYTRIAWERVEFWYKCMRRGSFDWLFFTGCDAAITNPNIKLESFISPGVDFIFACDGCGLQSDSWLLRNCQESLDFLLKVIEMEGKAPNEQDAMQLVLSQEEHLPNFLHGLPCKRKDGGATASPQLVDCLVKALNRSPLICKIVPQKALNAYPLKLYGGTGKEEHSWQPNDFLVHVPGKAYPERMYFFRKLQESMQHSPALA